MGWDQVRLWLDLAPVIHVAAVKDRELEQKALPSIIGLAFLAWRLVALLVAKLDTHVARHGATVLVFAVAEPVQVAAAGATVGYGRLAGHIARNFVLVLERLPVYLALVDLWWSFIWGIS